MNLGNISNSTKNINGIIKFQVIQHNPETVQVLIVTNQDFNSSEKTRFIAALTERLGDRLEVTTKIVDDIPTEKSGKFRIVKNLLG